MVFTLGNPDVLCEPFAAGSFCSLSSPEEYRKLNFPRAVLLGSGRCFYVLLVSGSHLLGVPGRLRSTRNFTLTGRWPRENDLCSWLDTGTAHASVMEAFEEFHVISM